MVNELNKSSSFNETDELTERLAASNRQLHEMQEEHRQLLQEMEMLRQRATQLARLNELQQQQKQQLHQQKQRLKEREQQQQQQLQEVNMQLAQEQNKTNTQSQQQQQQNEEEPKEHVTVEQEQQSAECPSSPSSSSSTAATETAPITPREQANDNDEDTTDSQSMDYIQQKLNEIAALKAQYRRVQTMINTTNLIEEHIASKSNTQAAPGDDSTSSDATPATTTSAPPLSPASPPQEELVMPTIPPILNAALVAANGEAVHAANEELLGAMLNMFNDFNSDLRNQADGLRSERERIRALKEELLQRKKQT